MQGGAFIKGEDDVCANLVLHAHRYFRGKAVHAAIDMRFKGHAIIINMGQPLFISSYYLI